MPMFWIVKFRRSCDPDHEHMIIVEGPDNDADAQAAFALFEPHAFDVSAKCMKGHLVAIIVQGPGVAVIQPRYSNPFSSN